MKKKLIAALMTGALAASMIAGCGSTASSSASGAASASGTASGAAPVSADASGSASGSAVTASGSASADADTMGDYIYTGDPVTIKIAASPTPHAEILEHVAPILKEEGITLDIQEFEDYVKPNTVVDQGEFDANYFQHVVYLNDFNEEQGTDLAIAGKIHYEPFGIYPGTKDSLDDVADGDTIAIPNDTTNEARALLLLQDNGLIKLKDGVGITATVNDIEDNPYNLKLEELEAAQVSRVMNEVAYVVLNGNYAQEAGLDAANDALTYEKQDSEAAQDYVNVIAVKSGNEDKPEIKALVSVLKAPATQEWMNETFKGSVVPYTGE